MFSFSLKGINVVLLKIIDNGIEIPYEIDTAKYYSNGKRWVQIWKGEELINSPISVDEALDEIEELMKKEENRYGRGNE